jgi:hypothetical protein
VQGADEVLARHSHVVEEHFVEVAEVGIAEFGEGPAFDAGRRRVDDQRRDALVLRCIGIRAHEAEAPVGVMRARCPHLLPVDDELVADQLGARAQTREIAPRVRLAHAEAPRDLGAQGGQQEPLLLFGRAVVLERRRDDPEPLRVGAARDLALVHLFEIDHLLGRRRVAPAELARPAGDQPAVVEQRALPAARPIRHVGARLLRFAQRFFARCVRFHPRDEIGAEAFLFGRVLQSHRGGG